MWTGWSRRPIRQWKCDCLSDRSCETRNVSALVVERPEVEGGWCMRKRLKKYREGWILTAPLLTGCLIFYVIPFVMVLWYSFRSGAGRRSSFVGLENYREILGNELFLLACRNTGIFLALGLPAILVLSYLIALILKEQAGKHRLLKSVLLFPYIMPVAGTVLLVDLMFAKGGVADRILEIFGLPGETWMDSSWAFWILLTLYLWKNAGYSVILLLAGLMTIPKEQYDAASLDGAGNFQKFRHITTPQMRNSVFFALLFSMINAFKCFREIFLIGGEHPGKDIYMLQHFLNNSFGNLNYRKLSAASVLLFLAVTVVVGSVYGWVRKKEERAV